MDSPRKHWVWQLQNGTASNDWDAYLARLIRAASRSGHSVTSLGLVFGEPLLMLTRPAASPSVPRLLLASGFHGEEPAGPWGVVEFLENADITQLEAVALTLLPLINVSGFRVGRRFNDDGQNPNRGYLPGSEPLTAEGGVLMQHADALVAAGRDGFLACHEDVDLDRAYLYGLEPGDTPGEFCRSLMRASTTWFPACADGKLYDCSIRDGIIFNHHDTSFESWMMSRGTARAACVETPGQQDITRRIAAQRAMIEVFVAHNR